MDACISRANLLEFFQHIFESFGLSFNDHLEKLVSCVMKGQPSVSINFAVNFLIKESCKEAWVRVSKKFLKAVEIMTLQGDDFEANLSQYDTDGSQTIRLSHFDKLVQHLSRYYPLDQYDLEVIKSYFLNISERNDVVSTISICSFIQIPYIGNAKHLLRFRIKSMESYIKNMLQKDNILSNEFTIEELYQILDDCVNISLDIPKEKILKALKDCGNNKTGKLNLASLLTHLDLQDVLQNFNQDNLEELFRLLIDRSRDNGIDIDNAFRVFDADGDGKISESDLINGLSELRIFDGVLDWKSKIPAIVNRFDKNGDGLVSLSEFYDFLGLRSYHADAIQRLTKIFAVASKKGVSITDIFREFDGDGDGFLALGEFNDGLKSIGTFEELTEEDVSSIFKKFDINGDEKVSLNDFVAYFDNRVKKVIQNSKARTDDNLRRKFKKFIDSEPSLMQKLISVCSQSNSKSNSAPISVIIEYLKSSNSFASFFGDVRQISFLLDPKDSGLVSQGTLESFLNNASAGNLRLDEEKAKERKSDGIIRSSPSSPRKPSTDLPSSLDDEAKLDEYEFSPHLEMKSAEKKLRRIGNILTSQGYDIEELFHSRDLSNSGCVRRSDFLEILAKCGVSLLAADKSSDERSDNVLRSQLHQIRRVKGLTPSVNNFSSPTDKSDVSGFLTCT